MCTTLRIFVSSVQKELEDERLIVQNFVKTDPTSSASRSAAAVFAGCGTRCLTTGLISCSSAPKWVTFRSPSRDPAKTSNASAYRRRGSWSPEQWRHLNDRQRRIVRHVLETGSVARRWCVGEFQIANDTAGCDLKDLKDIGILTAEGKGRSLRYVMRSAPESANDRAT